MGPPMKSIILPPHAHACLRIRGAVDLWLWIPPQGPLQPECWDNCKIQWCENGHSGPGFYVTDCGYESEGSYFLCSPFLPGDDVVISQIVRPQYTLRLVATVVSVEPRRLGSLTNADVANSILFSCTQPHSGCSCNLDAFKKQWNLDNSRHPYDPNAWAWRLTLKGAENEHAVPAEPV